MRSVISTQQAEATTTSHFRSVSSGLCSHELDEAEFHHLHMAWILTADTKGNPRPQMHWLVD